MPLILAPIQRAVVDRSELEASLVYKVSSRVAKTTQRNPCLRNKTTTTTKKRVAFYNIQIRFWYI